MSRIRDAAVAYDLSAALWRVAITQDNNEIRDLLPEQVREFATRFPDGSAQKEALLRLIASR